MNRFKKSFIFLILVFGCSNLSAAICWASLNFYPACAAVQVTSEIAIKQGRHGYRKLRNSLVIKEIENLSKQIDQFNATVLENKTIQDDINSSQHRQIVQGKNLNFLIKKEADIESTKADLLILDNNVITIINDLKLAIDRQLFDINNQ